METKDKALSLGYVDLADVVGIEAAASGGVRWVLDLTGKIDTYAPADRCGEPFRVSDYAEDSDGDRWFLFAIADSHFPVYSFVRGDSFEDAYEYYVDHRSKYLRIDDDALPDYFETPDDWDTYRGSFDSEGNPVDTESIVAWGVTLTALRFKGEK